MEIRVISDVHLEMNRGRLTPNNVLTIDQKRDKDRILVVAGDLTNAHIDYHFEKFFDEWSRLFRHVIYIPGNHEFYGNEIYSADFALHETFKKYDNVDYHRIYGGVTWIDDVAFVCHPLFTSMGNSSSEEYFIERVLNDFRMIEIRDEGYHRYINARDYKAFFADGVNYIQEAIRLCGQDKVVVVTHWTPSYQSVHKRFKGSALNGGFSSDLDQFILDNKPDVWIHGHTHDTYDYYIGDTRIVCNPIGIEGHDNNDYDPKKVIEV